ncbi:MAG: hypothetical protein QMD14_02525 [Candidatus Aenigmarchaeota archaeon]|nr:hypothetical protein [Candidatus Aenigmarchaeota archaeon]
MARGIVRGAGGFFFVTFLLTTILLLGLTQFTQYGNLKPIITDIIYQQVRGQMNETQLSELKFYFTLYCQTINETIKFNFTFVELEVNCSEILDKQPEQIIKIFASKTFDTIYYKEYEYGFIDCLKNITKEEEYSVVISKKSNTFFEEILRYSLLSTVFFLLIFLLASKNWYSRTRDLGISLIFIGVPYFVFEFFIYDLLQKFLPIKAIEIATPVITAILDILSPKFFLILIGGIILLLVAFILRAKSRK